MGLSKTDRRQLGQAQSVAEVANSALIDALADVKLVLARVHARGTGKDDTSKAGQIAADVATYERELNATIEQLLKVEQQAAKLL